MSCFYHCPSCGWKEKKAVLEKEINWEELYNPVKKEDFVVSLDERQKILDKLTPFSMAEEHCPNCGAVLVEIFKNEDQGT